MKLALTVMSMVFGLCLIDGLRSLLGKLQMGLLIDPFRSLEMKQVLCFSFLCALFAMGAVIWE